MVSLKQGNSTTFQLVDEFGAGESYGGLTYTATDSTGRQYSGHLDKTGTGRIFDPLTGPVALMLDQPYQGPETLYRRAQSRAHYPLKITELQVRAERTRYLNQDATRTRHNPAQTRADEFLQVEVRHLVRHVSHLPPEVYRHFPHDPQRASLMGEHGRFGVAMLANQHTVLEIRPLRALRPMLSTSAEFCALNLYQLALMATLSYRGFGMSPEGRPVENAEVSYPLRPSVGNWFGDALAKSDPIWRVDAAQIETVHPLLEDVPYSRRLEIVPFDPELYDVNDPQRSTAQETPESAHFLDDRNGPEATDTQAFITHSDELILIAIRGTSEVMADGLRDVDAVRVPFQDSDGRVHRGFYQAARKAHEFVKRYLDRFHGGQTLLICGHSLGGAVALLLGEMLRRDHKSNYTLQLYTYGAPRVGDAAFAKGAATLLHYRVVNNNDPVPSVPGMPYVHHGSLRHLMPVEFARGQRSSILWEPGCVDLDPLSTCPVALEQKNGLPLRPSLLSQLFQTRDHSMTSRYIPACWAVLRRWQEALASHGWQVTDDEFEAVKDARERITQELRIRQRDLLARPDAYVRTREREITALKQALEQIQTTVTRLTATRHRPVSATAVYGTMAERPAYLAQNLSRWQARGSKPVASQVPA